jgi:hypothetical protein
MYEMLNGYRTIYDTMVLGPDGRRRVIGKKECKKYIAEFVKKY